MTLPDRTEVVFLAEVLTHYRVEFHGLVRAHLAKDNIAFRLLYGKARGDELLKGDLGHLEWAEPMASVAFGPGRRLIWQRRNDPHSSGLVILSQENRFLSNYLLQLTPRFLRPRIAFFGHGRNFQARDPDSLAERWKRFWATRVDWWFAYTDETRRHIESLGFPRERITVFNNAVDTSQVRADFAAVTPERLAARRQELGLTGGNVAIFVGGIYADKRIAFLVEAARAIRAQIPDFELIVAGGGPDAPLLAGLARDLPWIKVVGPRFGADKVELMALANLFLMPGLVGLAVVDAGAANLPTVTTAFPWHSPEIAYIENGKSGVIVPDWENAQAYADAVAALLGDPARLSGMRAEAARMARSLTIEAMAERFADGVMKALAA